MKAFEWVCGDEISRGSSASVSKATAVSAPDTDLPKLMAVKFVRGSVSDSLREEKRILDEVGVSTRPRHYIDSSDSLPSIRTLKDYLKERYEGISKEDNEKKPKSRPVDTGVIVVDEDPVWQKPVVVEEENEMDLSPPWQRRNRQDTASPEPDQVDGRDSPRKNKKRKTGLITGKEMTEEIANTKKRDWKRFQEMDPSISGRHAEPIYRDKITGNRITKEEFVKSRKKVEKEIKMEQGKGLPQKRKVEARLEELDLEKNKPFARTRDDPDLNRMQRDAVRWGDPMAHLVKKK